MPQREDYLIRLIQQAFDVLRRLRARLMGDPLEADEVVRGARDAQAELLGPLFGAMTVVDADTAVGLMRDRERLEAWVELMRLEAEALRVAGDAAGADTVARRADAVVGACDRLLEPATEYWTR
jgi:hypothetical protein